MIRWRFRPRHVLWLAVPAAVASIAWANRPALLGALGLMRAANPGWLGLGVLAIVALYHARGTAYGVPLAALGFTFPRSFLWSTALTSSAVNQLVPSGGASGYAFLTWALRRHGAPGGQASLVGLIDTLSYAFAVATLVVAAFGVVAAWGGASVAVLAAGFAPGLLVVVLGIWVYRLQRRRARLTRVALGLQARLGALVGRAWPERSLRRFLAEYYAGKRAIRRHPASFLRMVGYQYVAVAADAAALYLTFLALGARPPLWVVFLGFVVATAGVSVVSAPGGGGSFEVIMSAFFGAHGIEPAQAVAATLLYRIVAFWLPIGASAAALPSFRRRVRQLRRGRPG
jgi:uncharacterized protein (TIRG00374 family)